jgi:RNA polymerase sigma factor (sigma-70 family)
MSPTSSPAPTPGLFAATRWTMVLSAAGHGNGTGSLALAELCRIYWPPLFAYIRWRGHDIPQAEDLTQAFFEQLLQGNGLASVDSAKGKFRSFLLASLKHFLANERDRAQALKRGGGMPLIAFDAIPPEKRQRIEPTDHLSPDKAFERQWALTLLDQALSRLRREYAVAGKESLFEGLKGYLTGDGQAESQAETATRLGMSEGAVKVALHRLRRRYREVLRDEIAQTVGTPGEVDEELRHLFTTFR